MNDKQNTTVFDEGTIIMIENVPNTPKEQASRNIVVKAPPPRRSLIWTWVIAGLIIVLLLIIVALLLRPSTPAAPPEPVVAELPSSTTAQENTEKLQEEAKPEIVPGVEVSADVINDVPMKFYALTGLRAEISYELPSPDDESVYLYTNSADVRADNGKAVCALVVKGELTSTGNNRSGYFAAVGDNMIIGMEYNDSIQNYVVENGGYFFRQFALVSAGQVGDVRLKGKVERCALALKDGKLYYVETDNRESMFDFAEALCDYGFTDAIYITGGKCQHYYRDKEGKRHELEGKAMPTKEEFPYDVPLLVFRKI